MFASRFPTHNARLRISSSFSLVLIYIKISKIYINHRSDSSNKYLESYATLRLHLGSASRSRRIGCRLRPWKLSSKLTLRMFKLLSVEVRICPILRRVQLPTAQAQQWFLLIHEVNDLCAVSFLLYRRYKYFTEILA